MWDHGRPPLGINSVAQALRDAGHDVKLYDLNVAINKKIYQKRFFWQRTPKKNYWEGGFCKDWEEPTKFEKVILPVFKKNFRSALKEIVSHIETHKLEALGFSVFTTNYLTTKYFIKILRDYYSQEELKIFVGGFDLYTRPWHKEVREGLIDAAIVGEGEVSCSQLLGAWENKDHISNIPGIVSRISPGQVLQNKSQVIVDLNILPIVTYEGLKLEDYYINEIPLQTSRGCFGRCTFCDEVVFGVSYRVKPAAHVLKEMQVNAKKHNANFFNIADSAVNPEHPEIKKFVKLLIDHPQKFYWGGNCCISKNIELDTLIDMKKAGCRYLCFGLESASPKVLELMNKKFDPAWASRIIKDCKTAEISVLMNVLVGFPGETEEDFEMTLKFIRENHSYISVLNTGVGMGITINSAVWNNPTKFNIKTNVDGSIHDGAESWETVDGENNLYTRNRRLNRIRLLAKSLNLKFTPDVPLLPEA